MSSLAIETKPVIPARSGKTSGNGRASAKLQRTRKPADMSLEDWQIALRRQFAQLQRFKFVNLGDEPVFSQFRVVNPQSGGMYVVTIRGRKPGDNHCTCPAIKVVHHAGRVVFQLAKVAIPRSLFALNLRRIERSRLLVPAPHNHDHRTLRHPELRQPGRYRCAHAW